VAKNVYRFFLNIIARAPGLYFVQRVLVNKRNQYSFICLLLRLVYLNNARRYRYRKSFFHGGHRASSGCTPENEKMHPDREDEVLDKNCHVTTRIAHTHKFTD